MRLSAIVTAAALLAAAPAFAASTTTPAAATTPTASGTPDTNAATQPQEMQGQHAHGVAMKIREDLTQAGFTDIRVMPESFLVRAKNKEGMPVMMIVNPDSVTAVTEIPGTPEANEPQTASSSDKSTGAPALQNAGKTSKVATSGDSTPAKTGTSTQ